MYLKNGARKISVIFATCIVVAKQALGRCKKNTNHHHAPGEKILPKVYLPSMTDTISRRRPLFPLNAQVIS